MNPRTINLAPNGTFKPVALRPMTSRNHPSFDLTAKPLGTKNLMDNSAQGSRQTNRHQANPYSSIPDNLPSRLLLQKPSLVTKNAKEIFLRLTQASKNNSKVLKRPSEEQESEKSSKTLSKAPNRPLNSHVSKDKLPANIRSTQVKPVHSIQQLISLGMLSKNLPSKQFNGKPISNLENRKPRVSNLPSQLAVQKAITPNKQPPQVTSLQVDARGFSRERQNHQHIKPQRLQTECSTVYASDKYNAPTTSTICEKSKNESSPRTRFRPFMLKENITSNAEIGMFHVETRLKCEESLVSLGIRRRQPNPVITNVHPAIIPGRDAVSSNINIIHSKVAAVNKENPSNSDLDVIHSSHNRSTEYCLNENRNQNSNQHKLAISEISDSIQEEDLDASCRTSKDCNDCTQIDFNHETFENQFDSSTLHYLIAQEPEYAPNPHYIEHRQKNLKWQMRGILFDWMQEVCSDYLFKRETFHLATNFVDRYLSIKSDIEKTVLQLVGLTSLFLAAKFEEVYTPKVENMVAAANNTYSASQILSMEQKLYFVLGYKVTPPTLNLWSNWYMTQWDNFLEESSYARNHPILKNQKIQARFRLPCEQSYSLYRELMQLIDTSILDVQTLQYKQRALIAAFLYVLLGKEYRQFSVDKIVEEFPYSSLYLLDESFAFNDLYSHFMNQYFGMSLLDLLPTIQYVSTYFSLPVNINLPVAAKIDKENVLQVC
jgi:hypothetical protein